MVSAASGVPPDYGKLAYLFSLPRTRGELARESGLDERRLDAVEDAAAELHLELTVLKRGSDRRLASLIGERGERSGMSANAVRAEAVRFNDQVREITLTTEVELARALDERQSDFDVWLAERWRQEVEEHGRRGSAAGAQALTHKVYATQYLAYTNYEVAIPDKYIKFANLGLKPPAEWGPTPAGYEGSNYAVNLRLGGTDVSRVKVLDVGPWNIDDNYWNIPSASVRPRRLFPDLPRGMPEAQAAFFDDYNGGFDQYGREVLNPAGIDLAPAVAADLGLDYLQNGWIEVTYNWEAGRFGATRINVPGYSTAVSKTGGFQVAWTGADPDFTGGLSYYDVQYHPANTAKWTDWYKQTTKTGAPFSGTPGRTYYFRVRARSTAQEVGAWSPVRRTVIPYDQNRLVHRKVGFSRLFTGPNSSYFLGTTRYSTTRNTFIAYKFTGKDVALISAVGPLRSKAKIYLDGKYVKTIDNFAVKTSARRLVFHHSWGTSGTHYLKIVNLATPGRGRFDIDGIAVGR